MWCEPSPEHSRVLFTLLGAVAALVLVVVPLVLIARTKGARGPLAITWVAASVFFSPLAYAFSDQLLHRNPGQLYWLPLTVAAGVALGLIVAQVEEGRHRVTFAVVGACGGAGLVTILLALLLTFTAATGTCLD
jgi:hypothetical protein